MGDTFIVNVDLDSCIRLGLEVDGDTVMWWLGQKAEAQRGLLGMRLDISDAARLFCGFARGAKHVWSHATFDHVILSHALKLLGRSMPGGYYGARDLRTLIDLAGVEKPFRIGTHHDALSDAEFQANHAIACFEALEEKR